MARVDYGDPQYKSYDDTWDKPCDEYIAYDVDKKPVSFKQKDPSDHKSDHDLYSQPTFYLNLSEIIAHPTRIIDSDSNDPKAIKHRKEGLVKRYIRERYVKELNLPFPSDAEDDDTEVVVLYNDNPYKKPRNVELTYIITKKI